MNNLLPQPLYEPRSTHTPHHTQTSKAGGTVLNTKSCGGHSTGETPSNIPNLEAKPGSADGTATDRLWESRTPPQHTQQERPETFRFLAAPSIHTPGPRHRPPHEAPTRTRPQFDQPTPRDTTHQRTNVAHICPRDMGCLIHDSLMMEQLPGPCGTSGNLCPNQYRFVLHSYARTIHAALPHRAFPGPHAQACTRG